MQREAAVLKNVPLGIDFAILNGKLTQTGVSKNFAMVVPIYADFGNGWVRLGAATMIGDTSIDLNNIQFPSSPKKVAVAALDDVLAEKIENVKQ